MGKMMGSCTYRRLMMALSCALLILPSADGGTVDFNNRPPGSYTVPFLYLDWDSPPWNNGVTEGRTSVVGSPTAYEGNSLDVLYPAGMVGPVDGGAQWRWELTPIANGFDELILEYKVMFAPGFDFVLGGKLPGLVGGAANTGGGKPNGYDGWSARMMWLGNGDVIQYVYHPDQPGTYGDSMPWNLGGQRTFTPGVWHTVRHRVVMNTPTQHDGIIQGWFDGELALDVQDLRFRDTDAFAIDTMYFSTFFGGADPSWAPSKDEHVYFDDFLVTVSLADFTGDNMVDTADLAAWDAGFGTSAGANFSQGDADRDGDVDGADFLYWQREVSPSGTTLASVPEPATGLLALLGMVVVFSTRRRVNSHGTRALLQIVAVGLPIALLAAGPTLAASIGDGSVQTWKDGRTAAATFTIDDNWQQDHAWWTSTASSYDIRLTWFVITGRVGTGNIAVNGNWSDFAALQAAGHDIQSHTVDHFPLYPNPPYSPLTLETNYSQAITDIETNVPGSDVLTLAYPYGLVAPNDKTVADDHYIASRGVVGTLNTLAGVDYYNVNSLSTDAYAAGFQYPGNDVGRSWADVSQLLTSGNSYYQGWLSVHSHGMNTDKKNAITGLLDYMTAQPDGFWFGSFADVAQYARERDAASLVTNVVSPEEINFTLSDTLDDTLFDEPLTVKVRVDNAWTQIVATQDGLPLPATLMMDGGEQFALVDSAPDAGVVSLREFLPPTADFDEDGDVDGTDFLAWQRGFGILTGATLAQGDANHDGAVTAADLAIWQSDYGTALAVTTMAVPEPTSALLFLAGLALWQLKVR